MMDDKKSKALKIDERSAAREAFMDYCLLGTARTLTKLGEFYLERQSKGLPVPTKSKTTLSKWCNAFNWRKRASDWDDEQIKAREEEWKDRQRQLREKDWQTGEKLRGLFDQMMETAPKFIKQKRQFIPGGPGQPDKEIITLAIKDDTMIRLAEVSSALQAKAVGTERTTTVTKDGEGGLRIVAFDYSKAIDVLKPEDDDSEQTVISAATQYMLEDGENDEEGEQNRNGSESNTVDADVIDDGESDE